MTGKKLMIIISVITSCFLLGCRVTDESEWDARKYVSDMAIDEKIGQLITLNVGVYETEKAGLDAFYDTQSTLKLKDEYRNVPSREESVTELNSELAEFIKKYHIGGVMLVASNARDVEQVRSLCDELHEINDDDRHLLIMAGEEGTDKDYTLLEPDDGYLQNSEIGSVSQAFDRGAQLGNILYEAGVDVDLSPVIDGNYNPEYTKMEGRAFSNDPLVVSAMAASMMKGIRSAGVTPCIRHYPGYGDVDFDVDMNMYFSNSGLEVWLARDTTSLTKCISDGVRMILVDHVAYPLIDATMYESDVSGKTIYTSASMSKIMIEDILKGGMKYDGVVITDSLSDKEVINHYLPDEAFINTIAAGADMAIDPVTVRCADDFLLLRDLYGKVIRALEDGTLPMERLDDAVLRVVTLKHDLGLL